MPARAERVSTESKRPSTAGARSAPQPAARRQTARKRVALRSIDQSSGSSANLSRRALVSLLPGSDRSCQSRTLSSHVGVRSAPGGRDAASAIVLAVPPLGPAEAQLLPTLLLAAQPLLLALPSLLLAPQLPLEVAQRALERALHAASDPVDLAPIRHDVAELALDLRRQLAPQQAGQRLEPAARHLDRVVRDARLRPAQVPPRLPPGPPILVRRDAAHDGAPRRGRRRPARRSHRDRARAVEADPDRRYAPRGVAHEPGIGPVVRRAGLSGRGTAVARAAHGAPRAFVDHAGEQPGHLPGDIGIHHLAPRDLRLPQHA